MDTEYLITDKSRLTALVMLGIKDQETFPLIFYRDNCADMALTPDDISEEYIASSRALAVTGTHLSHANTRAAVLKALEYARRHGLRTALDIDYRPVLWGLTSLGDGETRFIESGPVTSQLQEVLHLFDLVVGTEEEFRYCRGKHRYPVTSQLQEVLHLFDLVVGTEEEFRYCRGKHRYPDRAEKCAQMPPKPLSSASAGPMGCVVLEGDIPDSWDQVPLQQGVRVEVLNVLGAGDAFMSGLLRGWLNDEGWEQACRYANACGALVVSRHGCAPAMPTKVELDDYLQRAESAPRPDVDERLNHLHRVTSRRQQWPELCIFAFDHRKQLADLARETGRDEACIPQLKLLLLAAAEAAAQEAGLDQRSGILADGTYGQRALNAITGKGWWIGRPIELPSSRPLRLEHGNIGSQLIDWPLEHVVKCLVFYHPDDPAALRAEQDALLLEVWQACNKSGHELLLEVILPENGPDKDERHYHTMLEHFYQLGIKPDWWKLPPLSSASWQQITALIEREDPWSRGILILGLDAPSDKLRAGFAEAAAHPMIKGFAVGRTIFGQPSRRWMQGELSDEALIEEVKRNYLTLIGYWREARR